MKGISHVPKEKEVPHIQKPNEISHHEEKGQMGFTANAPEAMFKLYEINVFINKKAQPVKIAP